jgi:hypothetical protein
MGFNGMGFDGSVELLFIYDPADLVYAELFLLLRREAHDCIGSFVLLWAGRLHVIYYPPRRR